MFRGLDEGEYLRRAKWTAYAHGTDGRVMQWRDPLDGRVYATAAACDVQDERDVLNVHAMRGRGHQRDCALAAHVGVRGTMTANGAPDAERHKRIREIERQHGVVVLHVCEAGSRAWGFASPDSDYDIRFIYVHERDWYLSVSESPRDTIEVPGKVWDLSGWELRKALRLLRKGNPNLLEWLGSPMPYYVDPEMGWRIRNIAARAYNPVAAFHHYYGLARANMHRYLEGDTVKLKKYLYSLRPIAACLWIEAQAGSPGAEPPAVAYSRLLDAVFTPSSVREAIDALLRRKVAVNEAQEMPPDAVLQEYVAAQVDRLASLSKAKGFCDRLARRRTYAQPTLDEYNVVFQRGVEYATEVVEEWRAEAREKE